MIIPNDISTYENVISIIENLDTDDTALKNINDVLLNIFCYNSQYIKDLSSDTIKKKGSRIIIDWNVNNWYVSLEFIDSIMYCYVNIESDMYEISHHVAAKISHTVKFELDKLYTYK